MQVFTLLPIIVAGILLFLLFLWLNSGNLGLMGVYPVILIICIVFFLIAYLIALLWKGIVGEKQTSFSSGAMVKKSFWVAIISIFVLLRISWIKGNNTYRPKGCMHCIASCDQLFEKVDKDLSKNHDQCENECYKSTHREFCHGKDACAKVSEQYGSCSNKCTEAEDAARAALPYKTREICVDSCFKQYPVRERSQSLWWVFFFGWPKEEG